jgi:branched-chain amino acid transport system permease protein
MQNVIFGLITGSILAVASAGFAMVRQTEGFLNIAHGQLIAVGAFLGFVFASDLGLPIFLAGALTMVCVGLLGILLARLVFDPVKAKGSLVLLFSSIGLAYVLYALILVVFGVDLRVYPVSFGERFDFWSLSITVGEIVIIALAFASMLFLHVFLSYTTIGTWIRAVASNPELARVRGVRVGLVSATVWFISGALAALAGVLIGVASSVTTEIGWANILLILAATVMGGLGRIYGVVAAALILGLAMDLSALVIPSSYRTVVAFGALILVLLVRPEGIFSVARRREQAA